MAKDRISRISAGSLTAAVFGALSGIGGVTHAIGEILQGNVAPGGFFFNSWTYGPIAKNLGGEPGLSVIPNVLISGIVTLLVSIAIIVWATVFIRRRYGGSILILLSILLLLFGGGIGPPTVGILAGFAGRQHGSQIRWWGKRLGGGLGRMLASLWPWVFTLAVANGIFLFVGSLVLACIFDINRPGLFLNSFLFAVISLLFVYITSIAHELDRRNAAIRIPDEDRTASMTRAKGM